MTHPPQPPPPGGPPYGQYVPPPGAARHAAPPSVAARVLTGPGPRRPAYVGGHHTWNRQQNRRVLFPSIVLVISAIATVLAIGYVYLSIGSLLPLVAIPALIPVIIVLATLLWIDRWEPEPGVLLLGALLWGAGVSVLTSLVGSVLLNGVWTGRFGTDVADSLGTVLTAPLVEEAFKGLFLILLLLGHRKVINGMVDGIVYAGMVGLGFAFVENLLYLGAALAENGLLGLGITFFLRCLLGPFAHPLFTSMTGLAVAAAARGPAGVRRVALPVAGYLGAVALHAVWNASAALLDDGGYFVVYGVFMIPVFIGMFVLVLHMRRREQRILQRHLPAFVHEGWIAPEEMQALTSLTNRRRWRNLIRSRAGKPAAEALTAYQTAVTELAFLRERIADGATGPRVARWHAEILDAMQSARSRAQAFPTAFAAIERLPQHRHVR